MRRRQILEHLVDTLKTIDSGTDTSALFHRSPYVFQTNIFNNVFNKYKFAEEINDFPAICVYNVIDSISHIGAGVKYGTLSLNIRGYVRNNEDPVTEGEKLIDDIEYVINNYKYVSRHLCVEESRVISLETDEGLFAPFGVINIEAQINYERQ